MFICRWHVDLWEEHGINKRHQVVSVITFWNEDLGEVDINLGVKVKKNENGLSLSQSHYVENLLKKFDSFDVSPVKTSYDASKHLKKNKGDGVSQPKYAKIIGSVMYLMNYIRPDIAYAVSRLSRYTHNPDKYH